MSVLSEIIRRGLFFRYHWHKWYGKWVYTGLFSSFNERVCVCVKPLWILSLATSGSMMNVRSSILNIRRKKKNQSLMVSEMKLLLHFLTKVSFYYSAKFRPEKKNGTNENTIFSIIL